MANYTAHYRLHQWEPEDSFLRGDFNEDFQKIDAGLAGRGDCSLRFGSYGELLEVEWTQDGLSWKLGGGLYNHDYQQLNEAGTTYYYAALYQESKEAPGNTRGLLASWGLVIRTQRIVKVPPISSSPVVVLTIVQV